MSTLKELLDPIVEQQGEQEAAGVAMVLWNGEGNVLCQYSGVLLDVPDISRLLLSGAMELTHRMQGKPNDSEITPSKIGPKIEVVE